MADKEVRLIDAEKLKRQIIEGDGHDDDRFTEGYNFAINEIRGYIDNMPTIEVEPDNGWISVDDRLPEAIYDCLVWYSCDTPFGKSKSVDITYCSRGDWHTKHLNGDNIVVLYWQPLPESPKGE